MPVFEDLSRRPERYRGALPPVDKPKTVIARTHERIPP
jgi:hypothetical protein